MCLLYIKHWVKYPKQTVYQLCEVSAIIALIFQKEILCLEILNVTPPRNHTGSKWKNWNAKIRFIFEITGVNKLPPEISVSRVVY